MGATPMIPLREQYPDANPFEIEGGPEAVLMIHGFTGTPAELRPLAKIVTRDLGWKVSAPLLAGHGTFKEDLENAVWTDWLDTVTKEFDRLHRNHARVHLVGLSMGAALAIEVYRQRPDSTASLTLLVPSLILRTWLQRWGTWLFAHLPLYHWIRFLRKEAEPHPDHITYRRYPAKALSSLYEVCRRARTLKRAPSPPAFICVSMADEIVHPDSATFLSERLENPFTRVLRLETSTHVVTLGSEKEKLFSEFSNFLREISPRKQTATSPS